jgi:hypothetical protein
MDLSEKDFIQKSLWSSVILAPELELNIKFECSFANGIAKNSGNVV